MVIGVWLLAFDREIGQEPEAERLFKLKKDNARLLVFYQVWGIPQEGIFWFVVNTEI